MNDKNKTRKNDENIIIMRCELLTSNLVAYHRNCIGVDITTFCSGCRTPFPIQIPFSQPPSLSHLATMSHIHLSMATKPLHLIHNVINIKLLSPCERSEQGGSKLKLKKKSAYTRIWCQRICLFQLSIKQLEV